MKNVSKNRRLHIPLLTFLFSFSLLLQSCNNADDCNCEADIAPDDIGLSEKEVNSVDIDMADIHERDTLRAIMSFSPTSYFLHRGKPMGFEYELIKGFADYKDLNLKVVEVNTQRAMYKALLEGKGDIIAQGLNMSAGQRKLVEFAEPYNSTRMVLVQKKPKNYKDLSAKALEDSLIRTPVDLVGKTIHVPKGSPYAERIRNLAEELGDSIHIAYLDEELTLPQLMRKIASGDIEFTVSSKNVADMNQTYLKELDVETYLSLPTRVAWAVRKNSEQLKEELDAYIEDVKQSPDYYALYDKYFENKKIYNAQLKEELKLQVAGRISEYDDIIKKHASAIDWDWRLVASQIYQESKFDTKAKSWAGARGLMQIMPATARDLNLNDPYNPRESIRAGTDYLKYLEQFWDEIPDSTERIKFILASYNTGVGHVKDAQRLAKKFGKPTNRWTNGVDEFMLLKAKPKYYNDPVVKYGYSRGTEPYDYVKKIFKRFGYYADHVDPLENVANTLPDDEDTSDMEG